MNKKGKKIKFNKKEQPKTDMMSDEEAEYLYNEAEYAMIEEAEAQRESEAVNNPVTGVLATEAFLKNDDNLPC